MCQPSRLMSSTTLSDKEMAARERTAGIVVRHGESAIARPKAAALPRAIGGPLTLVSQG
jgi:hypothetical protein